MIKNSNLSRLFPLVLLVSAAAQAAAAPAPVTSIRGNSSEIERLERLLDARTQVQVYQQQQLSQMERELDELRGIVEQNNHLVQQLQNRQRDLYNEIDALKQTKSESTKSSPSANNNDVKIAASDPESAMYEAAVDLILKKKNYAGAVQAFDGFLAKYPKSSYAPNAYYWLGQLYLSKEEFDASKKHFAKVLEYKDSNKRAEALVKLGVIATKQNESANAKKYFGQVIKQFPDTTSASQAKKLLDAM
ncbi:MAG: tol-pal system protein YbgF [Vibrionaceae bacterium]